MDNPAEKDWAGLLQEAKVIPDFFERQLYVAAVVNEAMQAHGIDIVLVGGAAVEFYTFGAYATRDLDMVCPGRNEALGVLATLGFIRRAGARHWYHPELDSVIEIPDEQLAGSMERLTTVDVNQLTLKIIAVEDLIMDRLRAWVFWKSKEDGMWAARLAALHNDSIDWDYLNAQAAAENLTSWLQRLLKEPLADS